MSGINFDFSELSKLAADLAAAPLKAAPNIRTAVEVTARNVKDAWREPVSGSSYISAGAAAISYDMKGGAGVRGAEISAEIGPELKGQGPLVGMLEYGTPNTGARGYGHEALRRNEADFEKGIAKAVEDVL